MSWGEKPEDFTGEPHKVFINFLIWNIKQIETCIYMFRRGTLASHMLMGLIDSLDDKSKEKLKKEYLELIAFRGGTRTMLVGDAERIYRVVLNHLHDTYLRAVGYAIPRFKSEKLEVPPIEQTT